MSSKIAPKRSRKMSGNASVKNAEMAVRRNRRFW